MIREKNSLVYTDGVCVYVSISENNPLMGKVALILADLLILSVLFFSVTEGIAGLIIFTVILLSFLTRYTLWNFWGKENLIINTKSVSYQHDYGLLKTSYTTKKIHSKLIVVCDKKEGVADMVQCGFITYHEMNHLPTEIYGVTFPITCKQAEYMIDLIEALYLNKMTGDYEFPSINLN